MSVINSKERFRPNQKVKKTKGSKRSRMARFAKATSIGKSLAEDFKDELACLKGPYVYPA